MDSQPAIAEHIRKCGDRPSAVFDEAHRHQKWVRSDWRQVNVEKVIRKITGCQYLTRMTFVLTHRWKSLFGSSSLSIQI